MANLTDAGWHAYFTTMDWAAGTSTKPSGHRVARTVPCVGRLPTPALSPQPDRRRDLVRGIERAVQIVPTFGRLTLGRSAMAFDAAGRLTIGSVHQRQGAATYDGTNWSHTPQPGSLPGTLVYDVAFAADGAAWYATDGGAARYDGARWQVFHPLRRAPSDKVLAVETAADGAIWLGTDVGAVRVDGVTGRFSRPGRGLAGMSVLDLAAASTGAVWAATYQPGADPGFALQRYRGWRLVGGRPTARLRGDDNGAGRQCLARGRGSRRALRRRHLHLVHGCTRSCPDLRQRHCSGRRRHRVAARHRGRSLCRRPLPPAPHGRRAARPVSALARLQQQPNGGRHATPRATQGSGTGSRQVAHVS